jgi:ornithine carbamoyltransferase
MPNALSQPRSLTTLESARRFDAFLASARQLRRAEQGSAGTHQLLRGRNLGLVCQSEEHPDAILFRSAASALGANVSHIRAHPDEPGAPVGTGLLETAHVLGRLYDGIECQGLAPELVRQLGLDAGVPVFDGLAGADHPTAQLAQRLAGSGSLAQKRQLILQAVLLFALR